MTYVVNWSLFPFPFNFIIINFMLSIHGKSHITIGERWHSGRAPCPYVLCLPQTYLRLWVQFLSSSPLYWVTTEKG